MTPADAPTIRRGDLILDRLATGLQCTTAVLVVPAALASQTHLSFAWWTIAPLLVSLVLWFAVSLIIEAGQRCGLLGAKLTSSSRSGSDELSLGRNRETAPVVRAAGDALPSDGNPVTGAARVHVAHVAGRGNVRFRIAGLLVRQRSI